MGRTYCPDHSDRPRSLSSIASRDRDERERRAAAVAEHVAAHGWVCPGWERPAHPSRDLTAAHAVPVAHGGVHSDLSALCRSCNSRQALSLG